MKILFLSPRTYLIRFLESDEDEVVQTVEPITEEMLQGIDFIISYGYRHKISQDVVDRFRGKIINLHISYLPYNRGADPVFWSVAECTPQGVTIHCVDGHIDTGDVLVRREVGLDLVNDTFRTLYNRHINEMENLFKAVWQDIRDGKIQPMPQLTYHRSRDKDLYNVNWDMPVKDFFGVAKN